MLHCNYQYTNTLLLEVIDVTFVSISWVRCTSRSWSIHEVRATQGTRHHSEKCVCPTRSAVASCKFLGIYCTLSWCCHIIPLL